MILALHYGFFLENGKPDKPSHGLRDAEQILKLAKSYNVDLIVHGHIHERFVLPVSEVIPVAIANTGSLTDKKHDRSYHIYEMTNDGFSVSVRRYDDQKEEFVSWPEAPGSGLVPFSKA